MRRRTCCASSILLAALVTAGSALAGDAIYPGRSFPISPTDLAAGDVDGDGDVDLVGVVVNQLVTLRCDGVGAYSVGIQSSVPSANSVALAHLDLDGKLDAVVGGLVGVYALPGDGFGGFLAPTQLLSGFQSGTPRVADLNEDGHPDVVAGNGTVGAGFVVIFGTGAGPVTTPVVVPGGGGGAQVEILDLNGDLHLDVLAVGPGINAWLGNGAGAFALVPPPTAGTVTNFNLGDFDLDGVKDLMLFSFFWSTGQFWKGSPSGAFTGPVSTSVPLATYTLLDYDQDGRIDLASSDSSVPGHLRILRCIGPLSYASPIHLPVDSAVSRAFPYDADSDGDVDVFVGGNQLTLLECRGPGDYVTIQTIPVTDPSGLATGDVNDDGYDDLVTARFQSQVGVSLGASNGSFSAFSFGAQVGVGGASDVDLADVDLDGDLDAIVATSAEVHLFHGDGHAGFTVIQTSATFGFVSPTRQEVADVNGDGRPDVALLSSTPGPFGSTITDVRVLPATPSGTFGAIATVFTGSQSGQDLGLGDVNGDSAADLFFTTKPTLRAIFSDGAGGFLPAQAIPIPGLVTAVKVGDLDGDGDRDLVVVDGAAFGGVRGIVNTGAALSPGPLAPVAVSTFGSLSLAIADADGSGEPDVLLLGGSASTSSSILEVVLGSGSGAFGPSITHSVAAPILATTAVRTFDGDHDGRVDVAFAAPDRDHVEIARNVLPSYFEYAGLGCPGSGGFVPRLRLDGVATPGGVAALSLANGLGGASALLFTGLQFASVPLPGGCLLHTFPLLPIVFTLPLSGGGPGDGGFALAGPLPGSLGIGSHYVLQALVIDSGAPFGFASTNAVGLSVQ